MTSHEIGEILRAIGRLEQKVDSADTKAAEILAHAKLTNGRVTALEQWRVQREEHERTLAVVAAEQEEAGDNALAERDRKMTRRDNIRNLILGAIFSLVAVVLAAVLSDLHLFS